MAFDHAENAIVADYYNNRILVFRPDGTFVTEFGRQGTGDGDLDKVYSVCVAPDGSILVGDSNRRISVFSFG